VIKLRYLALVAVGLTAASCKGDYLTGGDLSNDPNRPKNATANQLFAASEGSIWALLGSDPARVTGMWARQFAGGQNQYQSIYNYLYDEGIQSGFNIGTAQASGVAVSRWLLMAALRARSRPPRLARPVNGSCMTLSREFSISSLVSSSST